ncbi:IS4 family transposase, partial [Neobacillus drentensis]
MNRKLNVEEDFQLISEELVKLFSSNYLDKAARKVSFLQRSSKFKPIDFISLCGFFNHYSGTKSLSQLCGILESKRNISLTTEGLNQRFNDTGVSLLRAIFQELLSKHFLSFTIPSQYQLDIRRLRILDSTAFELPVTYIEKYQGYHKSGVRIQLEYDLLNGEFLHLAVQNGRESDYTFGQTLSNSIKKHDLIIRDLGYLSFGVLAEINKRDAYYISRLKTNIVNYVKEDTGFYTKLDLDKIMEEMEIGEVREIENIYVGKDKMNIPRLILCKLTDEQTEQRKKRLQKKEIKKGVKVSHQTQKLSRLNMFISNIPYQSIPKEEIQPFYSLRWQIEI